MIHPVLLRPVSLFLLMILLLGGVASAQPATTTTASGEWKLVWNDEFSGTGVDRGKWVFETGPARTNNELECYTDRPENAFVKDGMLHIRALKEESQGRHYTSTRMNTSGHFSKAYGRFEFRAKFPLGKGLWPALWMMPEQSVYGSWPASGEIDIMEARGQEPGKVLGTTHFGSRAPANTHIEDDYFFPAGTGIQDFHVYALEWEPGVMRYYIDGKQYATKRWWWSSSKTSGGRRGVPPASAADLNPWPAPFDKPFHIIMNLAVGGNFLGSPDASTPFPADMVVDYVRVYDKVGGYGKALPPEPNGRKYPFEEPSAGKKGKKKTGRKEVAGGSAFARGADVSWLPEMETQGVKFYSDAGQAEDCLKILKDHGINAIRLRVWVNPRGGWCDKAHTVALAKRAWAMGFRIMIDFHYSDYWADPGKQNKPAAWAKLDLEGLKKAVYDHTFDVMSALKGEGINVEWAQVGNETNDGMLWEDGRASKSFDKLTQLLNGGYAAIKSANPTTKVILHVSNGYNAKLFRWFFDGVTKCGAKYDVIGMSLYPDKNNWAERVAQTGTNMNDMAARYDKEVMICEVGMNAADAVECKAMLTELQKKVKAVPGGKGLGVLYWEPECYGPWRRYRKGAFEDSGKPSVAMDAFVGE